MKKILVIRYGALGDSVLTLPVLHSLKKSGYSVTLAGNSRYGELLLRYGDIDGFIPSDGSFLLPLFAGEQEDTVSRYLAQFDIILSYSETEEPFSLALKKSFKGEIIIHSVNPVNIKKHIVLYLLEPVRSIANFVVERPDIKVSLSEKKEFFVIHPGSGSIHKNWDKEKFLEVYRYLSLENTGYVLLGYAEDYMVDFWKSNLKDEEIIYSPDMNKLMGYLQRTKLYIGNDSGISHLFAISGIPSVVIFGPTSPSIWAPCGKNVKIVYKGLDCSPCSSVKRENCRGKECLGLIGVYDVIEAVKGEKWRKT